jgi:hypothetical protein
MSNDLSHPKQETDIWLTQYWKVLFHPSVQTFAKEKDRAKWSSIWLQLIILGILSAALDICALLIAPSQMPPVPGLSQQDAQLITDISTAIVLLLSL